MANLFYDFVDNELQKALPPECKRIAPDKLLGKDVYKIRYAFQTAGGRGKSKLVNILVLPLALKLDKFIETQLIKLRDYILSKNCLLVVISEEEQANSLADTGQFIEQDLLVEDPGFLWLICSHDQDYRTSIQWNEFEHLHTIIHDLWQEEIHYGGPRPGWQMVNLEFMQDQCWSCRQDMLTVTGVVFPNKQLDQWDNPGWLYYHQLFPLSQIEGANAHRVHQCVEQLRVNNPLVTPVGDRYSRTVQTSYLAASCPRCEALRGDFHVGDYRMQYLHSLQSRVNGDLQYLSVSLAIDQEMIDFLSKGYEGCDHTCGMGWARG